MPSEPPTVRNRVTEPLAAPMFRSGTLFWVISMVFCIRKPMPRPSTVVSSEASTVLVLTFSSNSRAMPTAITAPPTIISTRYFPVRLTAWPEPIITASIPNISGSSSRPLAVGEAPRTYCRYCGRKFSAPNMAAPTRKLMIWETVKLRSLNISGGRMGSVIRPCE